MSVITDQVKLNPTSAPAETEGAMYYDSTSDKVVVWNGTSWEQVSNLIGFEAKGTGGQITDYASGTNNYVVHTFTTSGVFTPTSAFNVDCLVVAGGGSGGSTSQGSCGGGGGAGGVIYKEAHSISSGTSYTITVGSGGGQRTPSGHGYAGNHSYFAYGVAGKELKGFGGGGGAGHLTGYDVGDNGGSGGGSENNTSTSSSTQTNHNGGTGYGTAGGAGILVPYYNAGGGGGASVAGGAASSGTTGTGGNGKAFSITGTSVTYAGGGSGGAYLAGTVGAAGTGGGGTGGNNAGSDGTAATVNTGGGGGGGGRHNYSSHRGGAGGSGIVIIRYTI
jgi:hypothetical protein